jgi:ABC-type antimicrobial peptide transport system permease subunit
VFGAVVAVLALIGLAASFIPARRVTRVDPVIALRHE